MESTIIQASYDLITLEGVEYLRCHMDIKVDNEEEAISCFAKAINCSTEELKNERHLHIKPSSKQENAWFCSANNKKTVLRFQNLEELSTEDFITFSEYCYRKEYNNTLWHLKHDGLASAEKHLNFLHHCKPEHDLCIKGCEDAIKKAQKLMD